MTDDDIDHSPTPSQTADAAEAARKARAREYHRSYYLANREKFLKEGRARYAVNREEKLKYVHSYRAANRERIKEYDRTRYAEKRPNRVKYDAEHREQKREYNRAWYAANRERKQEYDKARRAANPEKEREQGRAYRAANRDKLLAGMRKWQIENREKKREYTRAYHAAHPEWLLAVWAVNGQKKRARRAAVKNTFTRADWATLVARSKRCHWCKKPFTKANPPTHDHVLPISRGGPNTLENSVCACRSCNSRKHNRLINPITGQGILL